MSKILDHAPLAELLERGQQGTGIVEKIVLFSNWIWNYTKYSERIAGAVITQDNDDRQQGRKNLCSSTLLSASTL